MGLLKPWFYFPCRSRSQRTSTFVCLMDLTDESMGLSVDFTRFHESSFDQKHGKPKINRQYITGDFNYTQSNFRESFRCGKHFVRGRKGNCEYIFALQRTPMFNDFLKHFCRIWDLPVWCRSYGLTCTVQFQKHESSSRWITGKWWCFFIIGDYKPTWVCAQSERLSTDGRETSW